MTNPDADKCPICAEPFKPEDICATDIEMGTVHAECLDGCEDNGAGEYYGDDYYRNGRFLIQRIGQRKALLDSHEVSVCRADEAEVIKFLSPYWEYMKSMWEPFSQEA